MSHLRAVSARVKFPNMPESDAQPMVWHVVYDGNGNQHDIYAANPIAAIEVFNRQQRESNSPINAKNS